MFDQDFRGPFFSALGRLGELSTPERLAPPRMRKPLRWVVLVITCSTWEWRPSRPVTGWESWWKHWEFKKKQSQDSLQQLAGRQRFYGGFIPSLYRVCRVYRFFVFPKVSIACPGSFGNVWPPCRASRCMDLHPRKIQLLGLITRYLFCLISLCE